MSGLLLPREVVAEEINAEIAEQLVAEDEEAKLWTKELQRIDPTIELRRAAEDADDPELQPGQWCLRKKVPGDVDAYIPLPAGRPPGSWILEWLSAADLWNPNVHRDRKEAKRKMREAKRRVEKLRAEQRQDEMEVAVRAARRIRGDGGLTKRTDLKVPPAIARERREAKERKLELPPGVTP
ncbi:MAG TPA: hypothetical protein VF009_06910 [Solirubrobacterales bacterium]